MNASEHAGIIRSAIETSLIDLNVSIPCTVEEDARNGTVSVRPAIAKTRTRPDGTKNYEITEIIDEVPIVNLGCNGFVLDIPVKRGCKGLLIFCDYDIDEWQINNVINPNTNRVHDQNDCFFIPAFNGGTNEGDCVTLRYGDSVITLCEDGITMRNGNDRVSVGGGVEIISDGDSLIDALKASRSIPANWG